MYRPVTHRDFRDSRNIQKIYKIDDFGSSRPDTKHIQKIYKIENPGGTKERTQNIYSQRASELKIYQTYTCELIFLYILNKYGLNIGRRPKEAALIGERPKAATIHLLRIYKKYSFGPISFVYFELWGPPGDSGGTYFGVPHGFSILYIFYIYIYIYIYIYFVYLAGTLPHHRFCMFFELPGIPEISKLYKAGTI